jgi:hypothetical protein
MGKFFCEHSLIYKIKQNIMNEEFKVPTYAEHLNEGHDGYMDKIHGAKNKKVAMAMIKDWMEDDEDFGAFRDVKWIGDTTEDEMDKIASKYEDDYI